MNEYNDSWDRYDEDSYPAGDDQEVEYWEELEDEDELYEHMYAPIQGNWDLEDYEDSGGFQKTSRRTKIRSVKTYNEAQDRAKKAQKIKKRNEAKTREEQRQKYYHYGNKIEEENEED